MKEPAYAHYTVERETSDAVADPKKAFTQALRWGWKGSLRRSIDFVRRKRKSQVFIDPQVAFHIADAVRVKDRSGLVVLSEVFDDPHKSEARHARITSDLLGMDVSRFRETYGIGSDEHGET